MSRACPLCMEPEASDFHRDSRRRYLHCPTCNLVFVPPGYHLSAAEEKGAYDLHRNSPKDEEYRRFLGRLFWPMQELLPPGSRGLDFGSGPGPTLSIMFTEAGHSVSIHDKFYAPDSAVFAERYDFITATEVLEHLADPRLELARLWSCLRPGGRLGIMTKLILDREAFSRWHYKNDPTHICFFSPATFGWLAAGWQAEPTFVGSDVVLFQKSRRY
jgi:hypothetical protein